MKLLSEGLLWSRIFVIFLFCQSIFAHPSTLRPIDKTPADSSENSSDSEEVTSVSDDASKDSADSDKVTLKPDLDVTSGGENQEEEEEETEEEEEHDAVDFLKRYGYLKEDPTEGPSSSVSLSDGLKKMQKFAGITVSGKLDNATKELIKSPRCGLGDETEVDSTFGKRFNARAKWRKNSLTYRIFGYPTKSINLQSNSRVNSLIAKAFKDWSDVANVNFQKTNSYYSDIKIDFLSGNHGDGYKNRFDGRGTTLAHAFYPENGRLHLDNDERWADGYTRSGPDMRQVTTHEIGHILGLGHSNVRNAIMYPYYFYRSNFRLAADDINGAVYLYGRKQPRTTTRRIPTPPRRRKWYQRFFSFFG